MAHIPFTRRELANAWRNLYKLSKQSTGRTNPHRLLLFYAVECGLKAAWLKHQARDILTSADVHKFGHKLDVIAQALCFPPLGPTNFSLSDVSISQQKEPRANYAMDHLHQAWRYGAVLLSPVDDQTMEAVLDRLHSLIEKELR